MSDDPLPHEVPPPEPERVRELVEAGQHACDPPALAPDSEWTCPACGQTWTADRDGVWRGSE